MRKKILVVEDDLELAELLKFNLTKAGVTVSTANDGASALRQVRASVPDLVLLDVMLPQLDGLAVCEILRRDRATATLPIILLTALSSQLARIAGLAAGANDYVTKPFKISALLNSVERILGPLSRQCNTPTAFPQ